MVNLEDFEEVRDFYNSLNADILKIIVLESCLIYEFSAEDRNCEFFDVREFGELNEKTLFAKWQFRSSRNLDALMQGESLTLNLKNKDDDSIKYIILDATHESPKKIEDTYIHSFLFTTIEKINQRGDISYNNINNHFRRLYKV